MVRSSFQDLCKEAINWCVFTYLGIALLCIQVSCNREAGAASPNEANRNDVPIPVEIGTVTEHTFQERVSLSANILPKRQVKIIPRVPGRLDRVLVEVGDSVEEGQIIAKLDQRDYLLGVKQAQAQLEASRANTELNGVGLSSAKIAQERMQALHSRSAISQSELEKVDDGYRIGLAQQRAAKAQVQLARVGLEMAGTKLADTVLRAPFHGIVVQRLLEEGELCGVMPPTIVLIIADVSEVKVLGTVSELHAGRIKTGMSANVRVDAFPDETFVGTVSLMSPMVDASTRTFAIHVSLPNESRRLEMGMSAEVELDLGEREVIAIPDDTLRRSSSRENATVFVVDGHIAREREISLGSRVGDLVEVREGLRVEERIIRSVQSTLRDGQSISPRTVPES